MLKVLLPWATATDSCRRFNTIGNPISIIYFIKQGRVKQYWARSYLLDAYSIDKTYHILSDAKTVNDNYFQRQNYYLL